MLFLSCGLWLGIPILIKAGLGLYILDPCVENLEESKDKATVFLDFLTRHKVWIGLGMILLLVFDFFGVVCLFVFFLYGIWYKAFVTFLLSLLSSVLPFLYFNISFLNLQSKKQKKACDKIFFLFQVLTCQMSF